MMRIIFHPKKFTFYRSFKHHHQSISFLKALVSPSIDQRKFIKSLKNLNKHSKTEGVFLLIVDYGSAEQSSFKSFEVSLECYHGIILRGNLRGE